MTIELSIEAELVSFLIEYGNVLRKCLPIHSSVQGGSNIRASDGKSSLALTAILSCCECESVQSVSTPPRVLKTHSSGIREGDPYLLDCHFRSAMMNFQDNRSCNSCNTISTMAEQEKETIRIALYGMIDEISLAIE